MKKNKYKDQNKKNYKKLIIVLFVMVFILLLANGILEIVKKNIEEPLEINYDSITTIKEVIEYYKSKYISEEASKDTDFYLDVYLTFCVPLYNDDVSNEKYYNNILEDSARILNYRSFKMIDKENDIIIKVICDRKKITSIIINDIEDYFIYMDSQISLKNYEEIETTSFSVQSEVLQRCIDNNWSQNTYLGERDSIFDEYYIYFDEGIEARFIDGKIYNIIFTDKYIGNVINNYSTSTDLEYIKASLGNPTFEDEELKIIGYKGEEMYVFFTGTMISVYRNSSIDADDFFNLADRFLAEEIDLLEFMNELTYMWPDYSEYTYDATSVFISYPLKGVEISINYDDINGILLYNNIKSNLSKTRRYLENTNFVGRLKVDLMFETEKRRLKKNNELLDRCDEYISGLDEETKSIIGKSLNYEIYPEMDNNGKIYKINFIDKFRNNPNRELNDGITSFLWLTNDYFLFSKKGKGIYFYNLENGNVQRIVNGNDEYILKGFENGILEYDNKKMQLQF